MIGFRSDMHSAGIDETWSFKKEKDCTRVLLLIRCPVVQDFANFLCCSTLLKSVGRLR